jgi:multiple sugar transport system substrate-binding protein
VKLDKEFIDDIQPKAAVAANVGAGPDIIWGTQAIPHLIPDKLLEVGDVAAYLGDKYGGWYDMPKQYGQFQGKWIALPLCVGGNYINFRKSMVKAAGFDKFPTTTDDFLKLAKELKKAGKPGGFALGHATGDANAWTHWLIWTFGGSLVDEKGAVVINSKETQAALEYVREMYQHGFIEGTAGWNDSHNNKAFLSSEISWTNNGISILAAANAQKLPIADDIDHAFYPIGPLGKPSELQLPFPMQAFKYTKHPNAAKALMSFLMEKQQYDAWLEQSVGYFTQTLKAYASHPVWKADPRREPFSQATTRSWTIGHKGPLGYAASQAYADFIIVDLVADAATGQSSPKDAMEKAQKRAERYYKV